MSQRKEGGSTILMGILISYLNVLVEVSALKLPGYFKGQLTVGLIK